MARVVAFGEIMMRLAPQGPLRLAQVLPGTLQVSFAGAEANMAASLAMLGDSVSFVTALPDGPLADACVCYLRGLGVDVSGIIRPPHGRLGQFYVETGANQRPSRVLYDRDLSAISLATAEDFDWPGVLQGAEWLHITGITPALSADAARNTLHVAQLAREMGLKVSCDVNFRSRLWRWKPDTSPENLAAEVLRPLIGNVDLLLTGAEDARLLGISFRPDPEADAEQNALSFAQALSTAYPSLRWVACSLRENISATHNNLGAALYDARQQKMLLAPLTDGRFAPYEIRNIVDRVGGGDAFAAGLLHTLEQPGFADLQAALEFATAAGCLAHSIVGDFNFSTREEIKDLVRGARTGRVVR